MDFFIVCRISIARKRAEEQTAIFRILYLLKIQLRDIDNVIGSFNIDAHQIDEVCTAGDEFCPIVWLHLFKGLKNTVRA